MSTSMSASAARLGNGVGFTRMLYPRFQSLQIRP
eukprot:CAMPEP_0115708756 /NCGR_PEP_ID=MMETSP0272-20121206/72089_1 /TAXON_ID=71861 /ORGANISM="Scrippsiella trochoidea, Strain CCMP3099" /LENGTH=33 /DNA_ID= /DNA_START= /DNA_END= /DNA_ORIENTATION=